MLSALLRRARALLPIVPRIRAEVRPQRSGPRTKKSSTPFVSPPTRFEANDKKATKRPSAEIEATPVETTTPVATPTPDTTTENGQAPSESYELLDGELTFAATDPPWHVAVTFPEGWTVQYGHTYLMHSDADDELGFYVVTVDAIYADACEGSPQLLGRVKLTRT